MLTATLGLTMASCGHTRLINKYKSQTQTKEQLTLFNNYMYPDTISVQRWVSTYTGFQKLVPPIISRTQMGISMNNNGESIYICQPSANPQASIDTAISIRDNSLLQGDWVQISNEGLRIVDSISFIDSTIHRKKIIDYPNSGNVAVMSITKSRAQLYEQLPTKEFKRRFKYSYRLVNGHFLLFFPRLLGTKAGATNFVGIDKKGRLYMDNYKVVEKVKEGKYAVYTTMVFRLVFKRL